MKIVKVEKHLKKFGIALMRYFILIGLAFVVLYPTFVKLSISFMDITDLYDSTVRFIPKTWTLSNYANAVEYLDYFKNLINTVACRVRLCVLQVSRQTNTFCFCVSDADRSAASGNSPFVSLLQKL